MPTERYQPGQPTHYWHTTPLHNLPFLLHTGALWSQRCIRASGVSIPLRSTAARDRKLGVDDAVHLSLVPQTPLLANKHTKGYPHTLLRFEAAVDTLPGAAFLRYNTSAWRHRDDFARLSNTNEDERAAFWDGWHTGRYPSAALLIPDCLPLVPHCTAIYLNDDAAAQWVTSFAAHWGLGCPRVVVESGLLPPLSPCESLPADWRTDYDAACEQAGQVLPPYALPFD